MHERKVTGTEFGVVVRARREAQVLDLPSDLMLKLAATRPRPNVRRPWGP